MDSPLPFIFKPFKSILLIRAIDGFDIGLGQISVSAVAGGPADSAISIGLLPGRAEMVQVVGGAGFGCCLVPAEPRAGHCRVRIDRCDCAAVGFRQQARAVVEVFADSLRRFGANQTVVAISLVAGDNVAGLATFFFVPLASQARKKLSDLRLDASQRTMTLTLSYLRELHCVEFRRFSRKYSANQSA